MSALEAVVDDAQARSEEDLVDALVDSLWKDEVARPYYETVVGEEQEEASEDEDSAPIRFRLEQFVVSEYEGELEDELFAPESPPELALVREAQVEASAPGDWTDFEDAPDASAADELDELVELEGLDELEDELDELDELDDDPEDEFDDEAGEFEPEFDFGHALDMEPEVEHQPLFELPQPAAAKRADGPLEIEVEAMDAEAAAYLAQVKTPVFEEQACEPMVEAAANVDPLSVPAWNKINTSAYAFVRGLRGMAQSPLVQLLAVGTMAVCMLLLGTTMLIFQNAKRVAHDLGIDTPVTVYMQPGADATAAVQLRERIAALPEVEAATRVSPEQALERLQEGLGAGSTSTVERGQLLEGIDASTLPESIEVSLIAGVEPGFADALAGRVQSMDKVEEVSVLGPWVQEVERMLSTLRWLALGVGALVSLACLAIVWSTIRLGVFARRSEIHILRLVGGTQRFVRGPFVVEGVLQGVLGTALALAGLWLAFEITRPFLERGMSLLFAAGSLHFFTMVEIALALVFGAMIGLIGSRAAVARHAQG